MEFCKGFNSYLNAIHASQHFMRLLIPYGGPAALESTCLNIVNQQSRGLLDSEAVHHEIQSLVRNYSSGAYLTAAEKDTVHSKFMIMSIHTFFSFHTYCSLN